MLDVLDVSVALAALGALGVADAIGLLVLLFDVEFALVEDAGTTIPGVAAARLELVLLPSPPPHAVSRSANNVAKTIGIYFGYLIN